MSPGNFVIAEVYYTSRGHARWVGHDFIRDKGPLRAYAAELFYSGNTHIDVLDVEARIAALQGCCAAGLLQRCAVGPLRGSKEDVTRQ